MSGFIDVDVRPVGPSMFQESHEYMIGFIVCLVIMGSILVVL